MTPEEYESIYEQIGLVRDEHLKTGRAVREILAAMRDEGYIDCTDDALERCAEMVEGSHTDRVCK